nr:ras-related protein Rab-44-like [Procambarus clarkii]
MSSILSDITEEPSTVGASSVGADAWLVTARAHHLSQESLEAVPAEPHNVEPFSNSLKEARKSPTDHSLRTEPSVTSQKSFSDSVLDSEDESDTAVTLDSDTGSFYSVQSFGTTLRNDSVSSLVNSVFHSENTLFDSAQSIVTPRASKWSSLSIDIPNETKGYTSPLERHNSLYIHPGSFRASIEERDYESWEYTSCPDLSHAGSRQPEALPQDAASVVARRNRLSLRLSQLGKEAVNSVSMSAVDGPSSPKLVEDADKKKKGLMSTFRKGRKTGRKLRQQKKPLEGGLSSPGTGVASDTEQEFYLESEPSAPNSPALVKSGAIQADKETEQPEEGGEKQDTRPATHERLNGSSSPKGSADSSKTPSPVSNKSSKIEDDAKKGDEKEERKKEKSKFGSFLARKDKKQKSESGSKISIVSNASATSSLATDASLVSTDVVATSASPERKAEVMEGTVKDDNDPLTTEADVTNPDDAASTDSMDPSFRSFISNVQFFKNWTANAEILAQEPTAEDKSNPGVDVAGDQIVSAEETSSAVEKTESAAPPNDKPSPTKVTSGERTAVNVVPDEKESPKAIDSPSPDFNDRYPRSLGSPYTATTPLVSPSHVTEKPLDTSTISNSPIRSKSSSPVLTKRLSSETITSQLDNQPPVSERGGDTSPPPTPPTVMPQEKEAKRMEKTSEGVSVDALSTIEPVVVAPGTPTPPSGPEGHGGEPWITAEGDRSRSEHNPLMESSGHTSGSWATSSADKREHLYKILVIGELGTGKTSIIKRYVHQFFSQHYRATIGVDFALKVLNWDSNTVIRLQLWDIAGQERFGNMTRVYYKEAVGAFVVFDVTRAQTFDAVAKWKTDLDTKVTLADGSPIPTVLLANKCDQPKEGVVNNPARMDDYCRERGFSGWFETSAKENINIDEASRFLVNKILSNEKQGMMMTESMDNDKISVEGRVTSDNRTGCRC